MSAIYGIVDLNKNRIDDSSAERLNDFYSGYKIDRAGSVVKNNAFFGCGIQFFTKQSEKELLPIFDEEKGILFTADGVLDNRRELMESLEISDEDTPDGRIVYESYLKWGMDCCKQLRGVFSFAVYDFNKNKLELSVDHFAQRCLHYHVREGKVYFSTLFFPLVHEAGLDFSENERWLNDCVSLRSPSMMTEPKETPVQDVYKVVSGTYVVIESDGTVKETRFYNPSEIPTNRKITPKESDELMRDTMKFVVKRIIENKSGLACQLSAGLDSTTVACIAARELAEKGENIRSYTSVPLKEAKLPKKGYYLYDESESVKTICNAYPNIIPSFIDSAERSYLKEVKDIIDVWELPCKSEQNAIWMDEMFKQAGMDGCKIMLAGSTGNCTLSAGDLRDVIYDDVKHFRFRKAGAVFEYIKKAGASRKKIATGMLKQLMDYYKWYFSSEAKNIYETNLTDISFGESFDTKKRFNKELFHIFPFKDTAAYRKQMYMVKANAQIGEINTKLSLRYGVLERDPMRTPEIVNLCFSFPVSSFAGPDGERRLVRVGMEGIVPEKIRNDIRHRGRQSGDNLYRFSLVWDEKQEDMTAALKKERTLKYLSEAKIDEYMNRVREKGVMKSEAEVRTLVDAYTFACYLEKLNCKM